jgi:beta-lactamase class C
LVRPATHPSSAALTLTLTPAELRPDSIFLVASVTKPVVATAVMQLVEKGLLDLDAPVHTILPAFATSSDPDDPLASARLAVTPRHLLTHTSGLPDAVPENHELRARQAPLADFSAIMIHAPLLFPPATNISYSSVALNVLGDIVESITGTTLGLYLKQHIFEPLGMKDTTLGIAADRQKAREVCLNLAGEYSGADSGRQFQHLSAAEGGIPKSNWNSDYWRELGAPWGGMTTTVGDLAILCQAILAAEAQLLSGEGIGLMTRAHTHGDQISVVSLRTFPRV